MNQNIIHIISLTTLFFKASIKTKTVILFFIVAILSIAISSSLSGINMGDGNNRLFVDSTIFIQSSILTVVAIFFALNYMEREKRGGIFIIPLSSGISRKIYFLSIIISQASILITIFLTFLIINFLYIFIFEIDFLIIYKLILNLLSSIILSTLLITIAQYVNSFKAVIYTILIYFIGNGLDELYIYSFQLKPDETLQIIYQIISNIIPNFYIFDNDNISIYSIYHFLTQILILSILGYIKFKTRVLKVENWWEYIKYLDFYFYYFY